MVKGKKEKKDQNKNNKSKQKTTKTKNKISLPSPVSNYDRFAWKARSITTEVLYLIDSLQIYRIFVEISVHRMGDQQ